MDIRNYLISNGWDIIHEISIPERAAVYHTTDDLDISPEAQSLLNQYSSGIYLHQKAGIEQFLKGSNVCLSTSTASGKSLVFQACALDIISRHPESKVIAIYPLKALATEQFSKWEEAVDITGIDINIGRVDGGIPPSQRSDIIKGSSIVTMTPDVLHAWVLSNLNTKSIVDFISNVRMIIIDEAHTYSGVFGSNSAFLFRRLNHIVSRLGNTPRYISSSATISNPTIHMKKLVGLDFVVVDQDSDTSPKMQNDLIMINPTDKIDLLSKVSELMGFIANNSEHQFITFVDSRKLTEQIATIATRETDQDTAVDDNFGYDHLDNLKIYPYRSGYEEPDRQNIQEKLSKGELRGVVSTSALEMGIDLPHITLGILVGIPNSATSFYQRIGRIGRHMRGLTIVINNGSVLTENIFRKPEDIINMPLSESTLYLDNPRIQYIHTLCLARQGGEHDAISSYLHLESEKFESEIDFPENFIELCNKERIGEIPTEYQTMKGQAGEEPNYVFPLRDVDVQYQVESAWGPNKQKLGSLSYNQLMREAYPGAIYYYQTRPFRVFRINIHKKLVETRREKQYTSKPVLIPSLIFPNLSEGNVYCGIQFGSFILIESNIQVRDSVIGYKERRGPNEFIVEYPIDKERKIFFNLPRFTRNYFTTGVLYNHPCLSNSDVKISNLTELIFEAFLIIIPYERQDINFGCDKHRAEREYFKEGDRFMAFFDQTYGSLRLTSRFTETEVIGNVLEKALDLGTSDQRFELNKPTLDVLQQLIDSLSNEGKRITVGGGIAPPEDDLEVILLPGSKGLNIKRNNEEFKVDRVFFNRQYNSLVYSGAHLSQEHLDDVNKIIVPIANIVPIPGESTLGQYNHATGEIIETLQTPISF